MFFSAAFASDWTLRMCVCVFVMVRKGKEERREKWKYSMRCSEVNCTSAFTLIIQFEWPKWNEYWSVLIEMESNHSKSHPLPHVWKKVYVFCIRNRRQLSKKSLDQFRKKTTHTQRNGSQKNVIISTYVRSFEKFLFSIRFFSHTSFFFYIVCVWQSHSRVQF